MGLKAVASLPQASAVQANWYNVATWGDSLTAGNEDGTGVTYPNVLASLLNTTVFNGGVGGQTSSQILTRFQARPDLWGNFTVIWSGRNDVPFSTVLPNIQAIVNSLPSPQRFVVLSVLIGRRAVWRRHLQPDRRTEQFHQSRVPEQLHRHPRVARAAVQFRKRLRCRGFCQ